MATTGFINGSITKILIGSAVIDEQIEANFNISRELIEFLNKSSGGFPARKYGKGDWSVSGKAHLRYDVSNGFEMLLTALMNGTELDIEFSTQETGDLKITGTVLIESLGESTGTEDGVEFDFSFKGSGVPNIGTV
jgi:hypothetical protein